MESKDNFSRGGVKQKVESVLGQLEKVRIWEDEKSYGAYLNNGEYGQ